MPADNMCWWMLEGVRVIGLLAHVRLLYASIVPNESSYPLLYVLHVFVEPEKGSTQKHARTRIVSCQHILLARHSTTDSEN